MLEYPIFSSLVRLSKYPRILLTWKKPKERTNIGERTNITKNLFLFVCGLKKEINIKIRIPKENILR